MLRSHTHFRGHWTQRIHELAAEFAYRLLPLFRIVHDVIILTVPFSAIQPPQHEPAPSTPNAHAAIPRAESSAGMSYSLRPSRQPHRGRTETYRGMRQY